MVNLVEHRLFLLGHGKVLRSGFFHEFSAALGAGDADLALALGNPQLRFQANDCNTLMGYLNTWLTRHIA